MPRKLDTVSQIIIAFDFQAGCNGMDEYVAEVVANFKVYLKLFNWQIMEVTDTNMMTTSESTFADYYFLYDVYYVYPMDKLKL